MIKNKMMDNLEQNNSLEYNYVSENLPIEVKRDKFLTKTEIFLSLFSIFILVFLFSGGQIFSGDKFSKDNEASVALVEIKKEDFFKDIDIKAKSVYVFDVNSGEIFFEKNGDSQLPLASLTKIMTAVTALSLVPESTIISVEKKDLVMEGDSGLYADEKWRLGDLLNLVLIESSNDGVYTVSSSLGEIFVKTGREEGRKYFIKMMNEKAKDLGLAQTYFNNESGLDENDFLAGGYGSARDMAFLIGYAVNQYPNIFRNTKYDELKIGSLSNLKHNAINTNKTINSIPGVIASKTGYTSLADGNLAIVFDAGFGNPISVVALGSTFEDRFTDVEKLTTATLEYLSKKNN